MLMFRINIVLKYIHIKAYIYIFFFGQCLLNVVFIMCADRCSDSVYQLCCFDQHYVRAGVL